MDARARSIRGCCYVNVVMFVMMDRSDTMCVWATPTHLSDKTIVPGQQG